MKIVSFDLESTGLNKEKDSIIQFSAIKFDSETYEIIDEFSTYVQPEGDYSISVSAYFKHGITPGKLKDYPYFKDIAPKILGFFKDCALLTYNGLGFDLIMLKNEFDKIGYNWEYSNLIIYDSFAVETRRNSNTLENTFKRYTGKTMSEYGYKAHDALSDVKATIEVFKHQNLIEKVNSERVYGECGLIKDMEFCGKILPCFKGGKWNGVWTAYVVKNDPAYINYLISSGKIDKNTELFLKQLEDNYK